MTVKLEEGRTYSEAEWEQVKGDLLPGDRWAVTQEFEREGAVRLPSDRTVTHLVPRTPSWAGAQVVRDALGRVWTINGDGHYDGPMTYKTAQLVGSWGDVTVLLDADGHIPPASLMEVNGVSREDLRQALRRHRQAELHDVADRDEVGAVLAALEGGR